MKIYGSNHIHTKKVITNSNYASLDSLNHMKGILLGTKNNIENGLIDSMIENITVDIKIDFLTTAQEFAEQEHKDPAAVLACTVLEDSLKKLATKHNLNNLQSKEMSVIANSLFSNRIIEKSTKSSIFGFKDLRNAAFHAQWNEVSLETVKQLLTFLPIFLEKHKI